MQELLKMRTNFVLIFCIILAICADNHCVVGGRGGRGRSSHSSHRTSHKSSTHSSVGGGGGWFSWFSWGSGSSSHSGSGGSAASATAKKSPAVIHRNSGTHTSSHAGFAKYGKDYEANFHNNNYQRQYTPIPHPYQSHFHPQRTGKSNASQGEKTTARIFR